MNQARNVALATLTLAASLTACASSPSYPEPGMRRTETVETTAYVEASTMPRHVRAQPHRSRTTHTMVAGAEHVTEADRMEWFAAHGRPAPRAPGRAYDQTLAPQVQYIEVERDREPWWPPINLSLGYSSGHHGHHGWSYGLGFGFPYYGW